MRGVITLGLALLLPAGLGTAALSADLKPNFVVIFCDDLGYGDLGCYGHPTIRTPHLDRMARDGQRWTNFYVGASVCTPSRAALLTGRLPIRSGMMSAKRRVLFPNSTGGLPASEITIAQLLQSAGYATAAVGKWHLGHHPQHLPTAHGFDSYWGIPYSNDMDAQPGFPGYRERALLDARYVAPIEQFNVPILRDTEVIERPANQHTITRRYTEQAVSFIRDHQEEPFFVYLAHSLPHIPLYASDDFLGTSRRGLFGDVVAEIDAGVGRILETLEELDLAGNTLVVFTSDNGPWLSHGTHGGSAGPLRHGKGTTFEGGMRVPAIFWWPDVLARGVRMDVGATMDLLPTLCSLAGVDPPGDRTLDGVDLSPVLLGITDGGARDTMFYWREEQLYAARVGPWKAHFITQGCYGMGPPRKTHDPPLLYHLEHDPGERQNLAGVHPVVVAKIKSAAAAHLETVRPATDQLAR